MSAPTTLLCSPYVMLAVPFHLSMLSSLTLFSAHVQKDQGENAVEESKDDVSPLSADLPLLVLMVSNLLLNCLPAFSVTATRRKNDSPACYL